MQFTVGLAGTIALVGLAQVLVMLIKRSRGGGGGNRSGGAPGGKSGGGGGGGRGRAAELLLTFCVILMLFGGIEFCGAVLGQLAHGLLAQAVGVVGSQDGQVIIGLVALAMAGLVALSIVKRADESALWLAFFLPVLVSLLSSGGVLAQAMAGLQGPANQVTGAVVQILGG